MSGLGKSSKNNKDRPHNFDRSDHQESGWLGQKLNNILVRKGNIDMQQEQKTGKIIRISWGIGEKPPPWTGGRDTMHRYGTNYTRDSSGVEWI